LEAVFSFQASLFCYNKNKAKKSVTSTVEKSAWLLFCLPQLHKFVAEKVVALIFRKFPRIQDFVMDQSK